MWNLQVEIVDEYEEEEATVIEKKSRYFLTSATVVEEDTIQETVSKFLDFSKQLHNVMGTGISYIDIVKLLF